MAIHLAQRNTSESINPILLLLLFFLHNNFYYYSHIVKQVLTSFQFYIITEKNKLSIYPNIQFNK